MTPDIINALFELGGGFLLCMNCWRLYKDKKVMGVYWPVSAFFATWGLWNIYYYPHLDQWWSFYAGILLVAANIVWVAMALYYIRKNKNEIHP